jgi:serine/threonine protein kinase
MKLDRYEVLFREDGSMFRLGQSRNSATYKALDLDLRTPVVLKVIRPEFLEDEETRKRFLREARAAALLRHPSVAAIYRLGEEDGLCFYVREFVEGQIERSSAIWWRDGPDHGETFANAATI